MDSKRTDDLQEIFLQDCNFRNLSKATIRDYDQFLTAIKNRFGSLENVTRQDIKELVLEKLNNGLSPATVNHYIRAIKAFHSFLHREEYTDSNKITGLSLITMPEKLKPVLEPEQVSRMIAKIPNEGFFNIRDKVMIVLLWDTAMRLNELLHIKATDLDFKLGTVKITGKGRKDRVVPYGQKTKRELVKYLKIRGENHSEYLFCTRTGFPVMPRNFRRSLTKYGKAIGVDVYPHLLRHSAATFLARNSMPAQHIQVLLGHSSLAVTQSYINRIVAQEGMQISHRRLSPGDRI
jgi:integrase/recombinase XerD